MNILLTARASAKDPLPDAPELRPFPRSVDSVSQGGARVSTNAAGGSSRDQRRWRHGAIPAALLLAGVAAVLAGTADPGPVRALGLVVALASVVGATVAWAAAGRSDLRNEEDDRRDRQRLQDDLNDLQEAVTARESILASLGDGVVLFTPDGRVAHANPAVKELLGRRFETITELVPSSLRSVVNEVSTGGKTTARELSVADHLVQVVALPSTPPGAVVLLVRDVTQARRVEELRRDFVANASHELKTPVASMVALSETLVAAANDPPALAKFLGRLQQEAIRLANLVQDLLALSRLEGGALERRPVRLDLVVSGEADRLRPRAGELGVRVVLDQPTEVVVSGAESDLGLLVHNLLDNAVRYTPDGGQVRISLAAQDGIAVLRVDDTGIGIPSRDLDRVFERFYRVDEARSRETGGTGLGLSIVRHIAESHGGTAGARSVLGAGSTFTVEIPLAAPAE
jgi:two-component system sensor histidine kinase SenX3